MTLKNVKISSFLHFLFYIAIISGVTKVLSQGGKLRLKGPLATAQGSLPNTQKKTWEMMVNPDVGG